MTKAEAWSSVPKEAFSCAAIIVMACVFASCSKQLERSVARDLALHSIPDGEVILLYGGDIRVAVILTNQSTRPERMDYRLFVADSMGQFDIHEPSADCTAVRAIAYRGLRVPWSGACAGRGYLYTNDSCMGELKPSGLTVLRTHTNSLRSASTYLDRE